MKSLLLHTVLHKPCTTNSKRQRSATILAVLSCLPIYRNTLQTFVMLLCGSLWSFAVFSHTAAAPGEYLVSTNHDNKLNYIYDVQRSYYATYQVVAFHTKQPTTYTCCQIILTCIWRGDIWNVGKSRRVSNSWQQLSCILSPSAYSC